MTKDWKKPQHNIADDFDVPPQSPFEPKATKFEWTLEQRETRRKLAELQLRDIHERSQQASISARAAGVPSIVQEGLAESGRRHIKAFEQRLAERERDCLRPDFKPH